jgi:hypothetical protein
MKSSFLMRLLPRIQDMFFISLFVAVLLLGQRMLNLDGDFPRHLLTGKYILENRTIPTTELFIPTKRFTFLRVAFRCIFLYNLFVCGFGWCCSVLSILTCIHIYPDIQQVIKKI